MIGKLIGEVARELRMNPRTLRYYEALRLLPIPPRSGGGYRLYDPEAIRRLAFIARAKALGFTLREVRQILGLRGGGGLPCDEVERILSEHVRRTDRQLVQLQALKTDLQAMLAQCRNPKRRSAARRESICPVVESFDNGSTQNQEPR